MHIHFYNSLFFNAFWHLVSDILKQIADSQQEKGAAAPQRHRSVHGIMLKS